MIAVALLLTQNPFADLKSTLRGDRTRGYFVTREETQKVLDACPNSQWRLIFALKWSDIHWA